MAMPIASPSTVLFSEVVAILTDPRWTVHAGAAPQGTNPPFCSVTISEPILRGRGMASECGPRLDDIWRISAYGSTPSQCQWLRDQLLGIDWGPGWRVVLPPTINADDSAAPVWWQATILMTLEPV